MAKRKQPESSEKRQNGVEGDSDSDDDMEVISTDFEFFDPQPAVDFHGIKSLLKQLFEVDAQLFDLSALVDLILEQKTIGSTVKTESNETDAWAFLTVLNLHQHREHPAIKTLVQYLSSKSTSSTSLSTLPSLLSPTSEAQVGLILTERVINMPTQIAPPMYKMLLEEVGWAIADKEEYNFTHFLVVSKTYAEVESELAPVEDDSHDGRPSRKKSKKEKGRQNGTGDETFYFHPEDEALQRHAVGWCNFPYSNPGGESDSKRAFQEMGIRPSGHMILIEAGKFEAAVQAVEEYVGADG